MQLISGGGVEISWPGLQRAWAVLQIFQSQDINNMATNEKKVITYKDGASYRIIATWRNVPTAEHFLRGGCVVEMSYSMSFVLSSQTCVHFVLSRDKMRWQNQLESHYKQIVWLSSR